MFFMQISSVARGAGRRATAAAAYRAGERIRDERSGELINYGRRRDVLHTEIFLPRQFDGLPVSWARSRQKLWNTSEHAEKRHNARVARVVTLFGMLRGVPQFLATASPRDRQPVKLSRKEYLSMQHIPAASVVDELAAALVPDALTGTIGRCGRGAPAGATRHRADLHKKHGHVSRSAPEPDSQPDLRGCRLQVPGKIRELLELRGQHRHFSDVLLTDAGGATGATGAEPALPVTSARGVPANHLALADEARGKLRCAAVFAARP